MSRGSFIPISTIERLCASYRRAQKDQEKMNLISSQVGNREMSPSFSLKNVEFNADTRVCRLEFLQTQQYRTIDRYVTKDYQKYPIYSDWKTKSKVLKKTIKLTNAELESLQSNPDPLIKRFADKIVLSLKNEELLPAWFIIKYLRVQLDEKLKSYDEELAQFEKKTSWTISKSKKYINERKDIIKTCNKQIDELQKKMSQKQADVDKINNAKPNFAKYLFSFGIYAYVISQKRKDKINAKIEDLFNEISQLQSYVFDMNNDISKQTEIIKECTQNFNSKKKSIAAAKDDLKLETYKKIDRVEPLKKHC